MIFTKSIWIKVGDRLPTASCRSLQSQYRPSGFWTDLFTQRVMIMHCVNKGCTCEQIFRTQGFKTWYFFTYVLFGFFLFISWCITGCKNHCHDRWQEYERLRHANIASVSLSNYPTLPPVELDAVPAVTNNSPGYNCKVTSLCFSIWFIATQKNSISKIYTFLRLWQIFFS